MKTLLETLQSERETLRESIRERETKIGVEFDLEDCFVSTWASDCSSRLLRQKIDLLENGGLMEFPVLIDPATGKEVAHKVVSTRYGVKAVTEDGRWVEINGARSAKNKGLAWEKRLCYAWAKLSGSGSGLSGAMSVQVECFRVANDPTRCASEKEIEFYRPF